MTARRGSTLALLTTASLAQTVGSALSAVLASSLLGPHDRGLMVIGITSATLAGLVAGMGTGSSLRSRLPRVTAPAARERLLATYTWWSVLAALGAGAVAAALCLGCAPFIDAGLSAPRFLVAAVVVAVGYAALTQMPDAWYAAGGFRAGGSWAAVMAGGGLLGVVLGALVDRSADVLLLGQGLGMVLAAAGQSIHLGRVGLVSLRAPVLPELTYLLRSGTKALGLTVGLTLALRADRYLLGAAAGAAAVGIYSLAATLSETIRMVPAALGQLVSREVALGRGHVRLRRDVPLAVAAAAGIGLLVAAGGWLFITPVFGAGFSPARPLLLILLLAEILFAPYAVASRGILGGGWMGTAGSIGLLGGIGAIALYGVAVPLWGMYGTAAASALCYAGLSLATCLLLRRHLTSLPLPQADPDRRTAARV
ncbi:hypothetical protein AB0J86_16155 [Micromonospora sp. NPDC049559]|uniref:lipopolysaccharide biosynthesis protein n=1 Tax=Micromonospora sp. NPDC049559 TaxID=3155923 RepID=UPI00343F1016